MARRPRIRRVGLASAVIALIAALTWALRPQPVRVDTTVAMRGNLDATVAAEGKTRVKNLFTVAAPVDGELERITFKAGNHVSPATVVARIWPAASRPLDPRSRAEADAAVVAARAAVARAEAAQKEAAAALVHAQSTWQTSRQLSKEGVVAAKEPEHAGHEVDIRTQAAKVSAAALDQARAALVQAEAAASTSTRAPGRSAVDVRAPVAGAVLRVLQESGGPVTAGAPLIEIGNTASLEVAADFLTSDAMAVRPGARATVLDWGGAALDARVRQVDPGAFTKVSALGLEEQRVPVILDFVAPPPAGLGHDFHVNVAIVVWEGRDVVTLPSTALFRDGDSWAVFSVRDGRARLTKVTVGRSDRSRTVIEQGLRPGDEVVVQPSDTVKDGTRIQPYTSAR